MCGIVGYAGDTSPVPILLGSLKRLEYRGYDSAGLCVRQDGTLKYLKRKGRISRLEESLTGSFAGSTLGMAHTRWATHGEPDEKNAHPHLSADGKVAIVHNGIIENFSSLRHMLEEEGFHFSSDTDSEVIAHLISKFYDDSLESAVKDALTLLEGAFGLLVMSQDENIMIATRRGSPLIFGKGDDFNMIASDPAAIVGHTRDIIYMMDGDVLIFDNTGYRFTSADGAPVKREFNRLKISIQDVEKSGFKHFMLKEIFEQPDVLVDVLRGRLTKDSVKLSIQFPETLRRIVIVACGTSWHSALIGKYLIERRTSVPVEVDYASEFRYRDPIVGKEDLLVVISQSGETADTLAALREAKRKGAMTLGIVNVVGSTIAREVHSGIFLRCGPEIGVASTKAFTSQVEALILLSLAIAGHTSLELYNESLELPSKIRKILDMSDEIRDVARRLYKAPNFLYLGRGINFPVALEGALKLKEISYIHAEGYPSAEMKHGPIALVDQDMPVVFIAPHDHNLPKTLGNMQEIKARKGKILTVTDALGRDIANLSDYVFEIPSSGEEFSPIMNVIPLQLLAYHIADLKGIDVDKPRNLAKSVTVE